LNTSWRTAHRIRRAGIATNVLLLLTLLFFLPPCFADTELEGLPKSVLVSNLKYKDTWNFHLSPYFWLAALSGHVNVNVPNMVAQMSSKLAAAGLNITSLLNKSRDDVAYTLIDVNKEADEACLREIRGIEGVIQVRQLNALV